MNSPTYPHPSRNLSVADGWGGNGTPRPIRETTRIRMASVAPGMPVASLAGIPTPTSHDELNVIYADHYVMHIVDSVLIDEALQYGVPFSFRFEQGGVTVQNIFPIKMDASNQISSSSTIRLQMHTETAFHGKKPDYVFLYCLRDDPDAGTTLSHIDDMLSLLSEPDIAILQQPLFEIKPDLSFIRSGADASSKLVSIINDSRTEITYDEETMVPTTGDAQVSFARLQQAIASTMQTIVLKESDYIVIPNRHYVHGRTPFTARYDGTDRWLKRILLRSTTASRENPDDFLQPID